VYNKKFKTRWQEDERKKWNGRRQIQVELENLMEQGKEGEGVNILATENKL
jgi:hypothetical protein